MKKRSFRDIDKNLNHKFNSWIRYIQSGFYSPDKVFIQFFNHYSILQGVGDILNTEKHKENVDKMYFLYYGYNKKEMMEIIQKFSRNSMLKQLKREDEINELSDFEKIVVIKWKKIMDLEDFEL